MGSLLRLALIGAVIYVAWTLYRRLSARPADAAPPAPQAPGQERMVSCAECGTHVPESSGVRWRDHFFCSPAHLTAWSDRERKD